MGLREAYDRNLWDVNYYLEAGKKLFSPKVMGSLNRSFSSLHNICSTYTSGEDLEPIKKTIGVVKASLERSEHNNKSQIVFLTELEERVTWFEEEIDNL